MTLQVEHWPLAELAPYAANARTHSAAQVAQIAASIRAFGFNVPCLVDDNGELIAGHGRLLAAKDLNLDTVPVIRINHLTEAQVKAFRLADNKLALNADWDLDLLAKEIAMLDAQAIAPELVGFSDEELKLIQSGWQTDLAEIEQHVASLDGTNARITITCQPADKETIVEALKVTLASFEGIHVS